MTALLAISPLPPPIDPAVIANLWAALAGAVGLTVSTGLGQRARATGVSLTSTTFGGVWLLTVASFGLAVLVAVTSVALAVSNGRVFS